MIEGFECVSATSTALTKQEVAFVLEKELDVVMTDMTVVASVGLIV